MKSYKQYCGLARALDIVGERWTLLIVRELLPGGRRYTDLLHALPGLTTNLLARRLRHLEEQGVVVREPLPPPARATVYALTPLGRQLEPAILALGRFGSRWLTQPRPDDHLAIRPMMVSLQRRYTGGMAPVVIALVADGAPYRLEVTPASLVVRDGPSPDATTRVSGPQQAFAAALGRGIPARECGLTIDGDPAPFQLLQAALGSPPASEPDRTGAPHHT